MRRAKTRHNEEAVTTHSAIKAGAISFFAQGEPKGQPRPRAFAKKMGAKFVARVYDARTAEGWKSLVAEAARAHLPQSPITEPISLLLSFVMPRPKKHYRTGKRSSELRDDAPTWHVGTPDSDNLAKAVMDALSQIGMWKDDGQVCRCYIDKAYGTNTGVRISLDTL